MSLEKERQQLLKKTFVYFPVACSFLFLSCIENHESLENDINCVKQENKNKIILIFRIIPLPLHIFLFIYILMKTFL